MRWFILLSLVIFLFASTSVLSAPPEKGLVLWFGFNSDPKGEVKDLSGMGNNGTVAGSAKWTSKGKYGGGMEFTNGVINVPNSESITFEEEITIALWIKSDDVPDAYRRLVTYGWASPGSYILGIDNHWMNMAFAWDITNVGGTRFDANMDGLVVPGEWQFVATTYDGKILKLYVDGELKTQNAANGKINGAYNLSISWQGTDPGGGTFVGIMDEVRLYKKALSDSEILQVMEEPGKMSISPAGKASTVWGQVKSSY